LKEPTKFKRDKHLFLLPLIGTGYTGGRNKTGQLISTLYPTLYKFCNHNNIDVGVVTNEKQLYHALQIERLKWKTTAWLSLEPKLQVKARKLSVLAQKDELVLFIGAGVSLGAGLPSWSSLLSSLADEAKMSDGDIYELKNMNVVDQARIIEMRLGGHENLSKAIISKLKCSRHSLLHSIIAGLPIKRSCYNKL